MALLLPLTRAHPFDPVHVTAHCGKVLSAFGRYQNYVLNAHTADGLEAGQYLVVYKLGITHPCEQVLMKVNSWFDRLRPPTLASAFSVPAKEVRDTPRPCPPRVAAAA